MKSDTTLTWNWFRVNVPTILAIGGLVWYTAVTKANIESSINAIEQSRVERSKEADRKFTNIDNTLAQVSARVEPLNNVTYRIGVVETQIIETNKRLDRFAETIVNSIDLIRRDVNTMSTRVEVLSQKIDSITPVQRTSAEGEAFNRSR